MFTNLKNKIFEEVKASPSKFQQLAQGITSSTTSSTTSLTPSESTSASANENFFSITEEDTPQNSPLKLIGNKSDNNATKLSNISVTPTNLPLSTALSSNNNIHQSTSTINNGTFNRQRKLSNSSIASDVSFRLPSYDSPAVYHLQSDLDVSASEYEYDTSSNKNLDLISKEQLHDAYKKALDRYQKYRSRFTDLAKRYRDLERDSTKAREVLVETQDKAIRRISELREQCVLEQQAKAHLEEALRIEMDDMQCKIKSYQTKLKLLDENSEFTENDDSLIKLDDSDQNSFKSNLSDDSQQLQNDLKAKLTEVEILNEKLQKAENVIENLKKREEENFLQLAQNKLAIHSELENRESEMKKFKLRIQELETNLQQMIRENVNFKKQATEILELKEKLKKIMEAKQEFEAKTISLDHIHGDLKSQLQEKDKILDNLKKQNENNLQTFKLDYEKQLQNLRSQNDDLSSRLEHNHKSEIDVAEVDNELNRVRNTLQESINHLQTENSELNRQVQEYKKQLDKIEIKQNAENNLKGNHQELQVQFAKLQDELENVKRLKTKLESDYKKLQEELKDNSTSLEEIENVKKNNLDLNQEFEALKIQLKHKEDKFVQSEANLTLIKNEMQEMKLMHNTLMEEKSKAAELNIEEVILEKQIIIEKAENESKALKSQVTNILNEIPLMEKELNELKQSHNQLKIDKHNLEKKLEKINKQMNDNKGDDQTFKDIVEEVENKLQSVESENSQLAEKNCLLVENSNRLEKLLKQEQLSFKETLENSKKELSSLNEKLSAVLNENSDLHNSNELIEHEKKTLQDQNEIKQKENLCVLDSNKSLESEIKHLKEQNQLLRTENDNFNEITNNQSKEKDKLVTNLINVQIKYEKMETELKNLNDKLTNINNEHSLSISDLELRHQETIDNYKIEIADIHQQFDIEILDLSRLEKSYQEQISSTESELKTFQTKFSEVLKDNTHLREQNETFKKELDTLNNQNQARLSELENLLKETNDRNQTLQESVKNATDFEKKLQNYEQLKIENEYLNTLTNQLETDLRKHKDDKHKIEEEIKQLKCEIYILSEDKVKKTSEISNQTNQLEKLQLESQKNKKIFEEKLKEAERDKEHYQFIINQNDVIQKELIGCQQKLQEAENLCGDTKQSYEEIVNDNLNLTANLKFIQNENKENMKKFNEEILHLNENLAAKDKILEKYQIIEEHNNNLQDKIKELEVQLAETSDLHIEQQNATTAVLTQEQNLKDVNQKLQEKLNDLESKSQDEILSLRQQIEELQENAEHIKFEMGKLKETELNEIQYNDMKNDRDEISVKLNKIMHEVHEVSNRNLFLEQKCENYLILEQSNERLKTMNDKLSRQLDETLVSMQHNEGIQANTEFEYLKNIMFQYLTGTVNGNNDTLVKVIAAVLKFSPQQTQVALEKEHQKHTLLGQFNNLL